MTDEAAGQAQTGSQAIKQGTIIGLIVLAAGVIIWSRLREPPAPAPPAPRVIPSALELASVDVATAESRVLTRSLPLSGSLFPVVQATIRSKVSGEVQEVLAREGQDVAQGDVIVRIDTRDLQARYDRELAAVQKAQADLLLATVNRDKNRSLITQHYISQIAYESAETAYEGMVANVKLAAAQARVAEISLEDAVVRAPFSGTLAKRSVQPGEKVSADTPIVTLVDLREMYLEAEIPAADIPTVRIGQKVHFTVTGFGARRFEGRIQRINPLATDGSRAITVYIAVANPHKVLRGGMFAQGDVTLEATAPVLSVPAPAVHGDVEMSFVYLLEEGRLTRHRVTLGPRITDSPFVEISDGLTAGERVVVADIGDINPARAPSCAASSARVPKQPPPNPTKLFIVIHRTCCVDHTY